MDDDSLAAVEPPFRLGARAVERHAARVDPALEPAPRMLWNELRQRAIEAYAGERRRHDEIERSPVLALVAAMALGCFAIIRAIHKGKRR